MPIQSCMQSVSALRGNAGAGRMPTRSCMQIVDARYGKRYTEIGLLPKLNVNMFEVGSGISLLPTTHKV
jgi:hypothetical protein